MTHYDITMGNDVTRDTHCDITMCNNIAMCTYHAITMHNGVTMNLFYCILFHTMTHLYMIYRYVFFEWILIRPVKMNQYDITMTTHYDITMDKDVAWDAHCEITMVMMFLGT